MFQNGRNISQHGLVTNWSQENQKYFFLQVPRKIRFKLKACFDRFAPRKNLNVEGVIHVLDLGVVLLPERDVTLVERFEPVRNGQLTTPKDEARTEPEPAKQAFPCRLPPSWNFKVLLSCTDNA